MLRKLESWLEQLAEVEPCKLVVRAGEARQSQSIIARYEIVIHDGVITSPTVEEIEDVMLSNGFHDDKPYVRCIGYDEKGRQLKSVSLKHEQKNNDQHSLVDGILAMAGEMRRFVSTINTTLEAREETLQHIIDQLMIAKHSEIESHAASIALDMELQKQEEMSGSDSKERALSLAESVVGQMMGARLSPAAIKDLILGSPELIDSLLEDDQVVAAVGAKFMKK